MPSRIRGLHQLEGFFHVARLGGYTKAAQAFFLSHRTTGGSISRCADLREDLGVTLVGAGPTAAARN